MKKEKVTLKMVLDAIRILKMYYPELEVNFSMTLKQKQSRLARLNRGGK